MASQRGTEQKKKRPSFYRRALFCKLGGDLLSRFRSTIGAGGLSSPVRHGKVRNPAAIATFSQRCAMNNFTAFFLYNPMKQILYTVTGKMNCKYQNCKLHFAFLILNS